MNFPISVMLAQLALDFESHVEVMSHIAASTAESSPALFEPESRVVTQVDIAAGGLHIPHDNYIRLALDILYTCAEDLVYAQHVLSTPGVKPRQTLNAKTLLMQTKVWLEERETLGTLGKEDLQSAFSFRDCMELLESELSAQSLGEISIPRIADRRAELAEWLLNDPAGAKHVLKNYKGIFGAGSDDFDIDTSEELDSVSPTKRERARARA